MHNKGIRRKIFGKSAAGGKLEFKVLAGVFADPRGQLHGADIAALAVVLGSFWLFCAATFFGGAYAAVVLSFRFSAADCVPPDRRPRALSFVMAGGVFAGVIGPQLVTLTMNLWPPHFFAGTYLAQAAVAALSAADRKSVV